MSFTKEIIKQEDMYIFEKYKIRNPFSGLFPVPIHPGISQWVIDRINEIILVSLGGQGNAKHESPEVFALIWKDEVSRLFTINMSKGNNTIRGIDVVYNIEKVVCAKAGEHVEFKNRDEYFMIIKQAFGCYGDSFSSWRVNCTRVYIAQDKFLVYDFGDNNKLNYDLDYEEEYLRLLRFLRDWRKKHDVAEIGILNPNQYIRFVNELSDIISKLPAKFPSGRTEIIPFTGKNADGVYVWEIAKGMSADSNKFTKYDMVSGQLLIETEIIKGIYNTVGDRLLTDNLLFGKDDTKYVSEPL